MHGGIGVSSEAVRCSNRDRALLKNDAVNLQPSFAKAFSGEVGTGSPQKMRNLVARAKSDSKNGVRSDVRPVKGVGFI
jgi:hypothetical protein